MKRAEVDARHEQTDARKSFQQWRDEEKFTPPNDSFFGWNYERIDKDYWVAFLAGFRAAERLKGER